VNQTVHDSRLNQEIHRDSIPFQNILARALFRQPQLGMPLKFHLM
jgi:hypothetical protein